MKDLGNLPVFITEIYLARKISAELPESISYLSLGRSRNYSRIWLKLSIRELIYSSYIIFLFLVFCLCLKYHLIDDDVYFITSFSRSSSFISIFSLCKLNEREGLSFILSYLCCSGVKWTLKCFNELCNSFYFYVTIRNVFFAFRMAEDRLGLYDSWRVIYLFKSSSSDKSIDSLSISSPPSNIIFDDPAKSNVLLLLLLLFFFLPPNYFGAVLTDTWS